MASTSTTEPNGLDISEIPIYITGVRITSSGMESAKRLVRSIVEQQSMRPNLVPTTYEESRAYLEQEGGNVDLLREMCLVVAVNIPENQEILMMTSALGIFQELKSGPVELTLYLRGIPVPSGTFPKPFTDTILDTAKQNFSNIVPTTYEASKAYLDGEMLKPTGERNLRREMCMIIVVAVPKNQEVYLKNTTLGILFALTERTMMLLPTVDYPPTAFGTLDDPLSSKLMDKKTSKPAQATIVLAYFTRTGDDLDYIGDIKDQIRVDGTPYQ
ncbi:hypothetical protein GALMADRAFT_139239 [Galerina marginata CBS 339.88]|uniref:Uncharacterized protein n=1 Tax=Galerina marginata (strain CBS 339.88) TaxID=685588 RepID=A0A067TE12_GALM3|nr:hypothetical protein GALMADRAFT_139239 [Galerina marginata CBS 339.88]